MIVRKTKRLLPLGLLVVALAADCSCNERGSGSTGPADPGPIGPPPPPPPSSSVTIMLEPNVTYQTIVGWEGAADAGDVQNEQLLEQYQDELFDLVVNELGLNRVRLPLPSGIQNTIDWFPLYQSGRLTDEEWRAVRYEISPERVYHFSRLDFWVEHSVEPMRRELAARGESPYVNLCYINFEKQVPNPVYHHWDNPEAYGGLIAAAFRHLDQKYGWVPDGVEVILEPEHVNGWTGRRIGEAIVAAGDSLRAAGYSPDFIAPSTTSMSNAVGYFDELITVPRVAEYLTTISYHRYRGVSVASLEAIASRAQQHGLQTAMLEHIGSGYEDLHEDLEIGMNSAWQQFIIAGGENQADNGGKYFIIDASVLGSPRIVPGERNRYLKLYFRYIRRDAVRIGAISQDTGLDPLAFRNKDGSYVVVVKAGKGAALSVGGLAPGTYGVRYSTERENDRDAGAHTVGPQGVLTTSIPAAGVLAIFRR